MKNILKKNKEQIILFTLVTLIYLFITIIFQTQTTIFYDTNNMYDVLLDTDTGILFNLNTFALAGDNSKHILFMQIVSLVGYPIYLLSTSISKLSGIEFKQVYAIGLITLQILVSATSITLVFSIIKELNIKKITQILIIGIMIFSYPQLFMSLNIERFIYGQLSLVFFIYIVYKIKNKNSYLIDLAAIPLYGITLTNIYLYGIHLLLEFKLNIKNTLKHLGVFTLASYIIIISTRAYNSLLAVGNTIEYDTKFILIVPIIDKIKMIILRLIYPTMYFPSAKFGNGMLLQNGTPNILFVLIMTIVFAVAIIGGIKHYKEKIPQLCLGIITFNILLHGIIGYNLKNGSIMSIHFAFAIILLLAYFSQIVPKRYNKILNIFLAVVLTTIIISNIQGFIQILNIGLQYYPK